MPIITLVAFLLFSLNCERSRLEPESLPEYSLSQKMEQGSLNGPYFGYDSPGLIPVKFPFDFMPEGYKLHSAPAFTDEGREVYFSAMDFSVRFSEKIFVMKIVDGEWTSPEVASFSGEYFDGSPSISRDGQYLVYSSARRPNGQGMNESGERTLWYVEKENGDWGDPIALGIDTPEWENGSDMSNNGTLFFDARDIYKLEFPPGQQSRIKALEGGINTSSTELHPCIAPNEKFIVFYSNRPGHYGSGGGDLYISFNQEGRGFGPALNLGPKYNEGHLSTSFPRLSPDGKYFFFLKLVSIPWAVEVYWVNSDALKNMSPEAATDDWEN